MAEEIISLPDHYVNLLERVIEENKSLREEVRANSIMQQKVLEELNENKASTSSSSGKRPRSSKRASTRLIVPLLCRQDFRNAYKTLLKGSSFKGFNMEESSGSKENQEITMVVVRAVIADNGGQEKCSWSHAELRGAASSYFKSQKDKNTRKNKGEVERHRTLCRRQGRMRDKLQRRIESLNSAKCSDEKKEALKEALCLSYTSSDESDLSEDENGDLRLRGYLVKKLPWERSTLRKAKQELDEIHLKGLNPRARGSFLPRRKHNEFSCREYPNIVIPWAVRRLADDQSNSNTPPSTLTSKSRLSKSV